MLISFLQTHVLNKNCVSTVNHGRDCSAHVKRFLLFYNALSRRFRFMRAQEIRFNSINVYVEYDTSGLHALRDNDKTPLDTKS